MSLYNKVRPTKFEQVYGNEGTVSILKQAVSKPDAPQVYLFVGPTGCGKTTLARIVAHELGSVGRDVKEKNAANERGIDMVRDITNLMMYKPTQGKSVTWIIDECHKLTNDAQNSFLKPMEDTPAHVNFIFCSTDPQKLIPTFRGRCSVYTVNPLDNQTMYKLLVRTAKQFKKTLPKPIYKAIIKTSVGLPRNALELLEQVLLLDDVNEQLRIVKQTEEVQHESIELARALLAGNAWKQITPILKSLDKQDAEQIRRMILGYCKSVLLNGPNLRAGSIMEEFIEPFYDTGFPGLVYAAYTVTIKD